MTHSSRGAPGEARVRVAREQRLADRLAAALARPAAQQPQWPDPARARTVLARLRTAPPVVAEAETARLSERLAAVARGEAFLLQSGDCAETFAETTEPHLRANLGLLKRMAQVLAHAAGLPVVPLARMAGQYAKPRSQPVDAAGLPAYRGDIVNSAAPSRAARTPDPERMLLAHGHAARAMAVVRRVGAQDPPDPRAGILAHVHDAPGGDQFVRGAEEAGRDPGPGTEEIYVGHEMLLLDYETAPLHTAGFTTGPEPLLVSPLAHFLWIGERTRGLDDAHLAVAELLANPVGVKIGPGTTPEQALAYVRRLDPHGTPGRLTLISRMGHTRVREVLPPIVEKVTATGHQVVWQCDPMHGNSRTTADGRKTRRFDDILAEISGFFEVHRTLGTHPGGLHLEATGEDVTECLGGARGLGEDDLPARYRTACDPRLNAEQAMELALTVAELLTAAGRAAGPRPALHRPRSPR
ncbi:3-deoxy-7-phosphoheptulonate synthase [Streptomyces sp. AK08-02]|uniref:3-deoxy-7-phosphoheptulonate synthase n=1 Tax=Streptomyces sp. AK08-02 TaxID=3028654 RepID=UPI0029A3873F|nr:3-deoxy-7-phosphoheptulonate synthase [Streptomyces sp. AK08-02]MDX3746849.1 3-deoxy-7-phosphoheptulonate synthase [Streptomyces sp. AK08-02]